MANQKDYYVYVHRDSDGNIFYVGKGTGDRAWSLSRHSVWHKYVQERLQGNYEVEIVISDLTEDEALERESQLITEYGHQLVNWINWGRDFDYEALARYHSLRNENRCFVNDTRQIEVVDLGEAVRRYRQALENMRQYESIVTERGLIGDLLKDDPRYGDPNILDRLTMCLVRLGKHDDAVAVAADYFRDFPGALHGGAGKRILKRIAKRKAIKSSSPPKTVDAQVIEADPLPPGWEKITTNHQTIIRLCRKDKALGRGKHYVDCVGEILQLRKSGNLQEAAVLLEKTVIAVERESERKPEDGVPPFYHRCLGITYRQLGRCREECLILKRFLSLPAITVVHASEFRARLVKAERFFAKTQV